MDRRQKRRVAAHFSVRVWGVDAKARPFMQLANVKNISRRGALIQGVLRPVKPGEIIHVQCDDEQAQYRVVWAGKTGSPREGELGVEALPSEPMIWDVNLTRCSEFVGKG